jgi:hypothetical protein
MMEYTLSLALVDFIPVAFSAVGVLFIARMISRLDRSVGQMAYLATVLIGLGGLTKAIWKLIIATSGNDIVWLDDLLFVFLGSGFTFLSWTLWKVRSMLKGEDVSGNIWLLPIGAIALFGLGAVSLRLLRPDSRTWVFILLTLTTISNLAAGILLIQLARRQQLLLAASLFLFNLIAIFALSGMAWIPEQSIGLQWIEESINVLAQGAFAFAAWRVNQVTAVSPTPTLSQKSPVSPEP